MKSVVKKGLDRLYTAEALEVLPEHLSAFATAGVAETAMAIKVAVQTAARSRKNNTDLPVTVFSLSSSSDLLPFAGVGINLFAVCVI